MRLQTLIAASVFLFASLAPAQTPATTTPPPTGFTETIILWPNGAPLALRHGAEATDGDIPKLYTYPATGPATAAGPHAAVVVMPGGGYTHLVSDKEGGDEARWLAAHGISAFVLVYRLSPAYKYPAPMLDGARAVRYVRSHAAALGVDPAKVGVWGFSAGGHLSAWLSVNHAPGDPGGADPSPSDPLDRVSDRPDFAIISYGRMDLSPAVPRAAATAAAPGMETVLGASSAQLDVVPRVTADTSPTFLYSTTHDQTVDSRNATNYYNALKANNVPAELHVFELGPHGTHFGMDRPPAERELAVTPTLLANWLQLHGWMSPQ